MTELEQDKIHNNKELYKDCFHELHHMHHKTPSVLEVILYMQTMKEENVGDIVGLIADLRTIRQERR